MSRYKVTGPWAVDHENDPFTWFDYDTDTEYCLVVQCADVTDQKDGHVYRDGAYRLAKATLLPNGNDVVFKAFKVGKGGTVPFYGEMAWAAAARLFSDEVFKQRRLSW